MDGVAQERWIDDTIVSSAGDPNRGKGRFDSLAIGLQPAGKLQVTPETAGRLVDREARAIGGNLEQDSARLAEVDRPEVVADEALGDVEAAAGNLLAQRSVLLVGGGAPGDVVDGARPTHVARPILGRHEID